MHVNPLSWVLSNLTWQDVPGYLGDAFVVASFLMSTMIPLRALTISSNICFIAYAYLIGQYPALALNAVLLPLNTLRLYQMLKLVRRVRNAAQGTTTMTALKPYMTRRRVKAGEVVFRKGDTADALHFVVSGSFLVAEIGVMLTAGAFVGELGLLSPQGQRTQSLECTEEGELLSISYEYVKELFFQNPDFGFHFLQLTAGRLFENLRSLENQVTELKAELAARGAR